MWIFFQQNNPRKDRDTLESPQASEIWKVVGFDKPSEQQSAILQHLHLNDLDDLLYAIVSNDQDHVSEVFK